MPSIGSNSIRTSIQSGLLPSLRGAREHLLPQFGVCSKYLKLAI